MPHVQVRYRADCLSKAEVDVLAKDILAIEVARAFHVEQFPETHLTPAHVEVWTDAVRPYDLQTYDVVIVVYVNDHKSRRARLKKAIAQIAAEVERVFEPVEVSARVRIFLMPGAFIEFGEK